MRGVASSFALSFSTLAGIVSLPVALFVLSDWSAHNTCVVLVCSTVNACTYLYPLISEISHIILKY